MIDLRSDTVTKPSPEMRLAMANAEVGDDVFGEDPSINRLQDMTADLLGFEAALFVPSGTMANQLCIKAHTQAGDEIIMEQSNHPFRAESGGVAALAGVQVNQIHGQRGVITAAQIAPQIRSGEDPHHAPTRLVCLENTHNRGGGTIYPIDTIREIRDLTQQHHIPLHLDGARLLNASVAMGVPATEITQYFDTATLCLSKGLGAPVGSLLAGSTDFVKRANRFRKMFGGGMRQAGIIAAAGIYALENNVERLAEDHHHAKLLAERLAQAKGVRLDPKYVETNILFIELDLEAARLDAYALMAGMREGGVIANASSPTTMRLVTHLDVSRAQVEQAAEVICHLLG
jgi:threonine aldolase